MNIHLNSPVIAHTHTHTPTPGVVNICSSNFLRIISTADITSPLQPPANVMRTAALVLVVFQKGLSSQTRLHSPKSLKLDQSDHVTVPVSDYSATKRLSSHEEFMCYIIVNTLKNYLACDFKQNSKMAESVHHQNAPESNRVMLNRTVVNRANLDVNYLSIAICGCTSLL